jgi:ribosomal protein S18 acetylase RimI-like enzyme
MIRRLTRKEVDDFDRARLMALGLLIFEARPEFYKIAPLDREALLLLLTDAVDVPGTEVGEVYGFFVGDALLGILAVVDAAELKDAQTAGTIAIVRELARDQVAVFRAALSGFLADVENIAVGQGKYVTHLAVAGAARGNGVGRALMNHVLKLYGDAKFSLHVVRANSIATDLYMSLGFAPQSDSQLPIRILVRPIHVGKP